MKFEVGDVDRPEKKERQKILFSSVIMSEEKKPQSERPHGCSGWDSLKKRQRCGVSQDCHENSPFVSGWFSNPKSSLYGYHPISHWYLRYIALAAL